MKPVRRQLISSEEAVPAKGQHTKPCSDCPWARTALPGWLGMMSTQDWILEAHGENLHDCHTRIGAECAGLAIYRANVGKLPREALVLPADRKLVFASRSEFTEHHKRFPEKGARREPEDELSLNRKEVHMAQPKIVKGVLDLASGQDGNAVQIMMSVKRALLKAGNSRDVVDDVVTNMKSGNYEHLLSVAMSVTEPPDSE